MEYHEEDFNDSRNNYCLVLCKNYFESFPLPVIIFEVQNNRVHQNVSLHISFLIFYGSLIGCIILRPQEVVSWMVTKILFPAEVVLCSQSEYQRIREMLSFWWTSLRNTKNSWELLATPESSIGTYRYIRCFIFPSPVLPCFFFFHKN